MNYAVLRKSDKSSLYLTREIAAILERDETFHADRYLYVVDRAQRQHFKALKTILEKMGRSDLSAKIEHVQYGRVRGLSTRNGRTEAVGEIIDKGQELALQFMKSSKTFCMDPEYEKEVGNGSKSFVNRWCFRFQKCCRSQQWCSMNWSEPVIQNTNSRFKMRSL